MMLSFWDTQRGFCLQIPVTISARSLLCDNILLSTHSTIPFHSLTFHPTLVTNDRHSLVMLLLEDPDHRLLASHAEMLLEVQTAQQWAPATSSSSSIHLNASSPVNASAAARNVLAELQHATKTFYPSAGILPLLHAAFITGPEEPQMFRIAALSTPQPPLPRPVSYATVTSAAPPPLPASLFSGLLSMQPSSVIWLQLDQLQYLCGGPAYTGMPRPYLNPTGTAVHSSNQLYTMPPYTRQTDTDSADQSLLGPQPRKTSRELFVPTCIESGFDSSCTVSGQDTIAAAVASTAAQRINSEPGRLVGDCSPHVPQLVTSDCSQAAQDCLVSNASLAGGIMMHAAHTSVVPPAITLSAGEVVCAPDTGTPTSASIAQGLRMPPSPPDAPDAYPTRELFQAGTPSTGLDAAGVLTSTLGRTAAVAVRPLGSRGLLLDQPESLTAADLFGSCSQIGDSSLDGTGFTTEGHGLQKATPVHSARPSFPPDGSPNSWSMFPGSLPALNIVPPPCESLSGMQTWTADTSTTTDTAAMASTCSSAPILGQVASLGIGFGGLDGLGVGSCNLPSSASSGLMQHHQQQQAQQQNNSGEPVCSDDMFACMLAEMARQQAQQQLSAGGSDAQPRSWASSLSQCEAPTLAFSPPQRQPQLTRRQTDACDSFFMHPAANIWPQTEGRQQGRMTDTGGFLTGGSPGQGLEQMAGGNRNVYLSPGSMSASQMLHQQRQMSRTSCGGGNLPSHEEDPGMMPFSSISAAGLANTAWTPAMPTHKSFAAAAAALAPGQRHGAGTHAHSGYTLSLQQQLQLQQQRGAALASNTPMNAHAHSLSSRASSVDGASSDGGIFGVSVEAGGMMGSSHDGGNMKRATHLHINIPGSPLQPGDLPAKAASLPGTQQHMGYAAMVAKQAPAVHSSSAGTDLRSGSGQDFKPLSVRPLAPPTLAQSLAMQQQYQQAQQQQADSHASYMGQSSGTYDTHQGSGAAPPGGGMWVRQDSMRPRPSAAAPVVMSRPGNLNNQPMAGQMGLGMMRGDGGLSGTSADSSRNLASGLRTGNVQMDSRWPGRVSLRVQDEIAALLQHTPMIKVCVLCVLLTC